ncbi:hypothetical protein [Neorhizobium galegae]|uniref:hypothetical protein n=1 Tax=Neorhizobium galegae TaxID=399 RepID=UPI00210483CB|nr:hypothetical protein [Neorhizobium galegae]MCQ1852773.1 hypothetical protein [Neorhizobium galegae]
MYGISGVPRIPFRNDPAHVLCPSLSLVIFPMYRSSSLGGKANEWQDLSAFFKGRQQPKYDGRRKTGEEDE